MGMHRRDGHAFRGARIALASRIGFFEATVGEAGDFRADSARVHVGIARVPGHGRSGSWWCGAAHQFRPERRKAAYGRFAGKEELCTQCGGRSRRARFTDRKILTGSRT